MIVQAVLCGIAFTCNCVFVTGTIHSSLMKVDPGSSLGLYRSVERGGPNEYDYSIVKRDPQDVQESPDSKERRSQMGSSFIRFGRGGMADNAEHGDYSSMIDETVDNELDSRAARGRSDVIIRFGRAESNDFRAAASSVSRHLNRPELPRFHDRGNADRHRKFAGQMNYDNDLDRVTIVCSNLYAGANNAGSNKDPTNYYLAGKLSKLCKSLGLGIDESDEKDRRIAKSKIMDVLEDAVSEAEYVKQE